jgi:hypothetical protein
MEKTGLIEYKLKPYINGVMVKLKYVNSPLTPLTKIEYTFDDGVNWVELSPTALSNTLTSQESDNIYTTERIFVPLYDDEEYAIAFRLSNMAGTGEKSSPGVGRRGSRPGQYVIKPSLTRMPYMTQYLDPNLKYDALATITTTRAGQCIIVFQYEPVLDGGSGSMPITDILLSLDNKQTWLPASTLRVIETTKQNNQVTSYISNGLTREFTGSGVFIEVSYDSTQGGDFTYLQNSPIYYKAINQAGESDPTNLILTQPMVIIAPPSNPIYPTLNKIESSEWYYDKDFQIRRDLQVYLDLPENTGFGEPYVLYSTQNIDLADYATISETPSEEQPKPSTISLTVTETGDTFRKNGKLKVYSRSNPSKIWFIATVKNNSRSAPVLELDILEKHNLLPYTIAVISKIRGGSPFEMNTSLWGQNIRTHPLNFPYLEIYTGDQLRNDDIFIQGREVIVRKKFTQPDIDIHFIARIITADVNASKLTLKITSKSICLEDSCACEAPCGSIGFVGYWEILPVVSEDQDLPTQANDWVIEPMYSVLDVRYMLADTTPSSPASINKVGLTIVKAVNDIPTLGYFTIVGVSDIKSYNINISYRAGDDRWSSRGYTNNLNVLYSAVDLAQKIAFLPITTQDSRYSTIIDWWRINKLSPLVGKTDIKIKLPYGVDFNQDIIIAYRKLRQTASENVEGVYSPPFGEGLVTSDIEFIKVQTFRENFTDSNASVAFPIDEVSHLNAEGLRVEVSYELSFLKITRDLTANNAEFIAELDILKNKIPQDIEKILITTPGANAITYVIARNILASDSIVLDLLYNEKMPNYETFDFVDNLEPNPAIKQTNAYRSNIQLSTNGGYTWRTALSAQLESPWVADYPTKYYEDVGSRFLTYTDQNHNIYPPGTMLSGPTLANYTYVVENIDAYTVRLSKPQIKAPPNSSGPIETVAARYSGSSSSYLDFSKGPAILYIEKNLDYVIDTPVKIINKSLTGDPSVVRQRPFMRGNVKYYNKNTGRLEVEIVALTASGLTGALSDLNSWEVQHGLKPTVYVKKTTSFVQAYMQNTMVFLDKTYVSIFVGDLTLGDPYNIWLRTSNVLHGNGPIIKLTGTLEQPTPKYPPVAIVDLTVSGFSVNNIYPGRDEEIVLASYEYAIKAGNTWYASGVSPTWLPLTNNSIPNLSQNAEYMLSFRAVALYGGGKGPATEPKIYKTASLPIKITSLAKFIRIPKGSEVVFPEDLIISTIPYTIQYELQEGYFDTYNRYIIDPALTGLTFPLENNSRLNLFNDLSALIATDKIESIHTYFVKFKCINEIGESPWSDVFTLSVLTPELRPAKVKWSPGTGCINIDELSLMDIPTLNLSGDLNLTSKGIRPPEGATPNTNITWQYAKLIDIAPKVLTDNNIYYSGKEQIIFNDVETYDTDKESRSIALGINAKGEIEPVYGRNHFNSPTVDKFTLRDRNEEPVIHLRSALQGIKWQDLTSNKIPVDDFGAIFLFRAVNAAGGVEIIDLLNLDGGYTKYIYNYIEPYGFSVKHFTDGPDFDQALRGLRLKFKRTIFTANHPIPRLAYNRYGRYIKYQEELFSQFIDITNLKSKGQPFLDFSLAFVSDYDGLGPNNTDTVFGTPRFRAGVITFPDTPLGNMTTNPVAVSSVIDGETLSVNDFVIIANYASFLLAYVKSVSEVEVDDDEKIGYRQFRLTRDVMYPKIPPFGDAPIPANLNPETTTHIEADLKIYELTGDGGDTGTITSDYLPVSNDPQLVAAFVTKPNVYQGAVPPRDGAGKDFWSLSLTMSLTDHYENMYVGVKVFKTNYNNNAKTFLGQSRLFRSEYPRPNEFNQYNAVFFLEPDAVIFYPTEVIYLELVACISPVYNTFHAPGTDLDKHTVMLKLDSTCYLTTNIPEYVGRKKQQIVFDVVSSGGFDNITNIRGNRTPHRASINKRAALLATLISDEEYAKMRENLILMAPIYQSQGALSWQQLQALEDNALELPIGDGGADPDPGDLYPGVPYYYRDNVTYHSLKSARYGGNAQVGGIYTSSSIFKVNGATEATYTDYDGEKTIKYAALTIKTPISTAIADRYSVADWLHGTVDHDAFKGVATTPARVIESNVGLLSGQITLSSSTNIPTYKYAKGDVVVHYTNVYTDDNQNSVQSAVYRSKLDNNETPVSNLNYWEPLTLPEIDRVTGKHVMWPVPVAMYPLQLPDPPMVVEIIEEYNRIGFVIKPPYFKKYKNNSTQIDEFASANYYDGGMSKDSPLKFRVNKSIAYTSHLSGIARGVDLRGCTINFNFSPGEGTGKGLSSIYYFSSDNDAFRNHIVSNSNEDELYIKLPGKLSGLTDKYKTKEIYLNEFEGFYVIEYYDPNATPEKESFQVQFFTGEGEVYIKHSPLSDHLLIPDTVKSRYETNTYWMNGCDEDREYHIAIRLDNGCKPKSLNLENTYTQIYRVRTKKRIPPAPAIDSIQYDGNKFKLNFTYGASPIPLYYNWQELDGNDYSVVNPITRQSSYYYNIAFTTNNDESSLQGGEATIVRTQYFTRGLFPEIPDPDYNYAARMESMMNDARYSAFKLPTDKEWETIERDFYYRSGYYVPSAPPPQRAKALAKYLNEKALAWFQRYNIPVNATEDASGSVFGVKYYIPEATYPFPENGLMRLATTAPTDKLTPITPIGLKNDPRGRRHIVYKGYIYSFEDNGYSDWYNFPKVLSDNSDDYGTRPEYLKPYSPTGKTIRDDSKVCSLLYVVDEYFQNTPYYENYADSAYLSVYRAPFRRRAVRLETNDIYADIDSSGYSYSHTNFSIYNTIGGGILEGGQLTLNSNGFYSLPTTDAPLRAYKEMPSTEYAGTIGGISKYPYYRSPFRYSGIVKSNMAEHLLQPAPYTQQMNKSSAYAELISASFPGFSFIRAKDFASPQGGFLTDFSRYETTDQEEFYAISDFAVLKSFNRNIPTYAVYVCQSQNICCVMTSADSSRVDKSGATNPADAYPSLLPIEHRLYGTDSQPLYLGWGFYDNNNAVDYNRYKDAFWIHDRYVWPYEEKGWRDHISSFVHTDFAYPASHMTSIEYSGYDSSWVTRNTVQLNRNISGDAVGENVSSLKMCQPTHVAIDGEGNIYISDTGNKKIKRLARSETPKDPSKHSGDLKNLVNYTSARTISTLDEFPGQIEVSHDGNTITFLAGGKLYRRIKGVNYLITGENKNTTNKTPAKNYQWPIYLATWGRNLPEDYGKEFISSFIQTTSGSTVFFSNGLGKVVKINMTDLSNISHVE